MTLSPFPTEVFGIPVVKDLIGVGPALFDPVNVVVHTTEGAEDGDPRPTFEARGDAPHFCTSLRNGGTIWQLRSLDQWAAALRHGTVPPGQLSPNAHAVQIEICGRSQTTPWSLSPRMLELVAACVAYMSQYHSVSLRVPFATWKDDCSDMPMPWAANNSRRQQAARSNNWPNARGVWEHVEVPWQDPTWHWDCGALNRTEIIKAAQALLTPPGGEDLTEAETRALVLEMFQVQTESDLTQLEACLKGTFDMQRNAPNRRTFKDPKAQAAYDRAWPVTP